MLDQMPPNVLTRKWLPQNDILAHPNVKLFITHGGLLSSQEAIFHGVPILGIPFYSDHHINIQRAVEQGYALKLDLKNTTVPSLRWAISELFHNPSYLRKIHEYSSIFRERQQTPMETAMFWIEYVIKFGGAKHLQSAARNTTWYNYFLVDILTAVCLTFVIIVVGCYIVFRKVLHKMLLVTNNKKYM